MAAGDSWLAKGANVLMFGPPGGGKSHLAAAIGLTLIENGWRVLFTRTTDLVQKLQVARRELQLEAAITKLDKFDLIILDDLAYVTKDQAETSVLFELNLGAVREAVHHDNRQSALRRMEQSLPRSGNDARGRRQAGPSCYHLRDERGKLQAADGDGGETEERQACRLRDNQKYTAD